MDSSKPGPGTYALPRIIGNELPKYTMRAKYLSAKSEYKPGPGNYESPTTLVERQANSKIGNVKNVPNRTSERFQDRIIII